MQFLPRLVADGDVVVLEEDARVRHDERQARLLDRLEPEEVVLLARLDQREARVVGEAQ